MNYVMSDIHGEYEMFLAMLKKIEFSDEDNLYLLGDYVDRGPQSIPLIQDLMCRVNVFCLLGNHDYIMRKCLQALDVEITEENYATQLNLDVMQGYTEWIANGGEETAKQYRALSREDKDAVLEFLDDLELYDVANVNGQKYLMVHSGLMNFDPRRPLDEYAPEEFIFERPDFQTPYFKNTITIVGHTPTWKITGKSEIYRNANFIALDCGAVYPDGRLACLCLDTNEEFYVARDEIEN